MGVHELQASNVTTCLKAVLSKAHTTAPTAHTLCNINSSDRLMYNKHLMLQDTVEETARQPSHVNRIMCLKPEQLQEMQTASEFLFLLDF